MLLPERAGDQHVGRAGGGGWKSRSSDKDNDIQRFVEIPQVLVPTEDGQ